MRDKNYFSLQRNAAPRLNRPKNYLLPVTRLPLLLHMEAHFIEDATSLWLCAKVP
jgi:hypothetical protein